MVLLKQKKKVEKEEDNQLINNLTMSPFTKKLKICPPSSQ